MELIWFGPESIKQREGIELIKQNQRNVILFKHAITDSNQIKIKQINGINLIGAQPIKQKERIVLIK